MTCLSGIRPSMLLVVCLALLLLLAASASAHENKQVAQGTVSLGPGEVVEYPVELHYHRLVGGVKTSGDDARVVVRVVGPDGADRIVAGPGRSYTVDAMVACCKGTVWSDHLVVVANEGPSAVDVGHRLVLLHDGFVVIAEDAEPGALASLVLTFVVLSGLFAYRLWRVGPVPGPWKGPLQGAWAVYGAMWFIAGVAGIYGMIRYGAGPVSGAIAAGADLPWLDNPILTTQDLILGSVIILWGFGVGLWTRSARRAQGDRKVAWTGIVLGAGSLVACALYTFDYGYFLAPVLIAVSSAAMPLAGGLWMQARGSPAVMKGSKDGPADPLVE